MPIILKSAIDYIPVYLNNMTTYVDKPGIFADMIKCIKHCSINKCQAQIL